MRHISFYLTQDQIRRREKTVTRRNGWAFAVKGMVLLGVVKGQGIPKGEKVQALCIIEITSARVEYLNAMTADLEYGLQEVVKEGFPEMTPDQFVTMYCEHNASLPYQWVRRIEFKYRDDLWAVHEMGKLTLPGAMPIQRRFITSTLSNHSTQSQEPKMAAKEKKSPSKPKVAKASKPDAEAAASAVGMDEVKAHGEKGQVDQSFAGAAPMERPGVPSDPAFTPLTVKDETEGPARRLPEVRTYTHAIDPLENLGTFQLTAFQEYTEAEYAAKGKELAAMDSEIGLLDKEMKEVVKDWKDRIAAVEARRSALSANINSKGQEKDIECAKRVNDVTGEATIFNVDTLEIVEQRQLTNAELQTELLLRNANASSKPKGAKTVKGNFPKDKVVGATAVENDETDAANEAAVRALAAEAGD